MIKSGRTAVAGKDCSCEAQRPECHSITEGGNIAVSDASPPHRMCRKVIVDAKFGCRIVKRSPQCRE